MQLTAARRPVGEGFSLMLKKQIMMLGIAAAVLVAAAPAASEFDWDAGRWRLELSGMSGMDEAPKYGSGETKVQFLAEYEFPVTQRLKLGLRLTPLLYYDGPNENVYGAGLGLSTRLYARKKTYTGPFVEGHVDALGHINRFEGNNSNINFQTGFGLGYQWKGGWNLKLQYDHISNASLGDRNSGADTMGLALGYRF